MTQSRLYGRDHRRKCFLLAIKDLSGDYTVYVLSLARFTKNFGPIIFYNVLDILIRTENCYFEFMAPKSNILSTAKTSYKSYAALPVRKLVHVYSALSPTEDSSNSFMPVH